MSSPAPLSENEISAPTGASSYALGFLALVPLPIVSFIVAALVMAGQYPRQRAKGELAAENGRRATNWGFTLVVLLITLAILLLIAIPVSKTSTALEGLPYVVLGLYSALGVVHIVVVILGVVAATRRRVFRNRLAIPFFKPYPPEVMARSTGYSPICATELSGTRR